jgi:hypothetical protein
VKIESFEEARSLGGGARPNWASSAWNVGPWNLAATQHGDNVATSSTAAALREEW